MQAQTLAFTGKWGTKQKPPDPQVPEKAAEPATVAGHQQWLLDK